MTVQDWMTPNPITVGPGDTAQTADEIMRANGIRHLPVVAKRRLVGIVTDRDLRSALPWGEGNFHRLRVKEMMVGKVITVNRETRVERAARLMIEKKIGALPVLKRTALVGIITTTDLLEALVDRMARAGTYSIPSDLPRPSRVRRLEARRTPRPEAGHRAIALANSLRSTRR